MDHEIFSWSTMWEVAGPFIIMGIVALVVGIICLTLLRMMKKWNVNTKLDSLIKVLRFEFYWT